MRKGGGLRDESLPLLTMTDKLFPLSLTIPVPSEFVRGKGIDATTVGANIRVRLTQSEKDDILRACAELGMTRSQYLRFCGLHVSHALFRELDDEGTI
jgi:hypothetical protein